jgi:hypothetical protein
MMTASPGTTQAKRKRLPAGSLFREIRIGNRRQVRCEGCSIIRTRPNGFLKPFDISLDMDHLLFSCLPGVSIQKKAACAKKFFA